MTEVDYKTIKFLTCGHVDDGKSTLIGRLLYDLDAVPSDQILSATDREGKIDYALFTDGLEDERRQGITIDVAYKYFRHADCRYRIADTPGHLEYMRNMAVAAVDSDLAIVLVDAINGVRLQTIEYSKIARFFGVRHFLIAVNKMDAVNYREEKFQEIKKQYLQDFYKEGDDCEIIFIPVSALEGCNIVENSSDTPWYNGPSVFTYLHNTDYSSLYEIKELCIPIQHVIKDNNHQRWYLGTLSGGTLRVHDRLVSAKGNKIISVEQIYHGDKSVQQSEGGQSVAIRIAEDVDISRGDVLTYPTNPHFVGTLFEADILWINKPSNIKTLNSPEIIEGVIKLCHTEAQARITVDDNNPNTLKTAKIELGQPIALDLYVNNPRMGLFIIIDSCTESIIMVGTIKNLDK
jgi:sulfate adenylyltransferase large subunit